jgi:hypothetical protein
VTMSVRDMIEQHHTNQFAWGLPTGLPVKIDGVWAKVRTVLSKDGEAPIVSFVTCEAPVPEPETNHTIEIPFGPGGF